MRIRSFFLLTSILIVISPTQAITLTGSTAGDVLDYVSSPGRLDSGAAGLFPVTYLAPRSEAAFQMANLINGGFSNDFSASAGIGSASGSIAISDHFIFDGAAVQGFDPAYVYASIKADYSGSSSYSFVQAITTNAPTGTNQSPYIDVPPNASSPYYPISTSTHFEDGASRPKPLNPHNNEPDNTLEWRADVFLVSTTYSSSGFGSIIIYDGFSWGFRLSPNRIRSNGGGNNLFGGPNPVPEPSMAALALPALLFVARRRSGRRR